MRWLICLCTFLLFRIGLAEYEIPVASDGWKLATGTYYGAPAEIARNYDKTRGEGAFGILAFGACGFTNRVPDGSSVRNSQVGLTEGDVTETLPYPRYAIGAAADQNPDYPGSCGRCYAVRCKSGYVLSKWTELLWDRTTDKQLEPITFDRKGYEGDDQRPYLGYTWKGNDLQGRPFPGNPEEENQRQVVSCWNTTEEYFVVRIADSCPCRQVLPTEVRRQEWCCGGVDHFDVSYYLFEKMAHPVYGVIMMEYRPVDCETEQPLPFLPGYISRTLYGKKGPQPGWSFWPWWSAAATLMVEGSGPDNSSATCLQSSPLGGVGFNCRECEKEGYQPFANATHLQFMIKANETNADSKSTTPGEVPPMKVFLKNENQQKYCNREVFLNSTYPMTRNGSWFQFRIPLVDFQCTNTNATLEWITRVDFQNMAERDAFYCLTQIEIV